MSTFETLSVVDFGIAIVAFILTAYFGIKAINDARDAAEQSAEETAELSRLLGLTLIGLQNGGFLTIRRNDPDNPTRITGIDTAIAIPGAEIKGQSDAPIAE